MAEAEHEGPSVELLFDAFGIGADQLPEFAGLHPPEGEPAPEITYEQFGSAYIRNVLNKDRVMAMVNDVLGPTIELGPIGAGPGRKAATVSVFGTFGTTTGEEIPGDLLAYRIHLPIHVEFAIDMRVDKHEFAADVVVPLTLTIHTLAPLRVRIDIAVPDEDEVELTLQASSRRGAMFQKLAGLEAEMRRFLLKVVRTELDKPYVRRATDFDMAALIDDAWDGIAAVILPRGPEDRRG
ncbi:MAG TPA: hypothetical protein VM093_01365 [Aeromicrobium sp.]|nr:hypothetical protein [Aeromicrobium sp.]